MKSQVTSRGKIFEKTHLWNRCYPKYAKSSQNLVMRIELLKTLTETSSGKVCFYAKEAHGETARPSVRETQAKQEETAAHSWNGQSLEHSIKCQQTFESLGSLSHCWQECRVIQFGKYFCPYHIIQRLSSLVLLTQRSRNCPPNILQMDAILVTFSTAVIRHHDHSSRGQQNSWHHGKQCRSRQTSMAPTAYI